jgi:Dehydrogenases with different specificities (related to short-chain alcohol dehydrogenases)
MNIPDSPDRNDSPVVLVTGTRKGIGRFLAEHFVRSGARVVGCSRAPIDFTLPCYTHHIADITREKDVKSLLSAIGKDFGRLDVAINNAGIAAMNSALLTPTALLDRVMAINFGGTALVCREAAKLMMRRKFGRIVNFSSVALPMLVEGEAAYVASKAAVVAYSRALARELAPYGITVNVVGPGPVDTDMLRSVPADKIQRILDRQAVKRIGRFEDVANVVDFFVRPQSDYVTGQVIYLGGV